jgi:type I restriction enzyme R subunit
MPQPTPEYIYVEKPTIDQLISMGWQYIEGSWDNPQVSDRENFKQVNPITEAIRDLLQYSNQRGSSQPEGAEKLLPVCNTS